MAGSQGYLESIDSPLCASASSSSGPSSHLSQASPALCSKSKNAHPASVILGFLMYSLGMIIIVSVIEGPSACTAHSFH